MKQPFEMTLQELRDFQVPSPAPPGGRSYHPSELSPVPDGLEPLWKGPGDPEVLRQRLGHSTAFFDPAQYHNARQGFPLKVWRASGGEPPFPGSAVFTLKSLADEHRRYRNGGAGQVVEALASPRELFYRADQPHPHEFFYVPDVSRWHRAQVLRAVQEGKGVPPHVVEGTFGVSLEHLKDRLGKSQPSPELSELLRTWGQEARGRRQITPFAAQERLVQLQGLAETVQPSLYERLVQLSGIEPERRTALVRANRRYHQEQGRKQYGSLLG